MNGGREIDRDREKELKGQPEIQRNNVFGCVRDLNGGEAGIFPQVDSWEKQTKV